MKPRALERKPAPAAAVDLSCKDSVMTNAGELMYAAPAPVLVPAQATRLQTFHVVIVAAPGLGAA